MTEDDLIDLIRRYNEDDWDRPFFSFAISDKVILASVWDEYPTGKGVDERGHCFYFVLDKSECVAIVSDMGPSNLHWYVLEKHRKRGIMSGALKNTILPHLFSGEREEQRATYKSTVQKDYLKNQGFAAVKGEEGLYYLHQLDVEVFNVNEIKRKPVTQLQKEQTCIDVRRIKSELQVIIDRVKYCSDDGYFREDVQADLMDLQVFIKKALPSIK